MKTVQMIAFLWIIIAISNWLTTRSVHTVLLQMLISAALLSLAVLIAALVFLHRWAAATAEPETPPIPTTS